MGVSACARAARPGWGCLYRYQGSRARLLPGDENIINGEHADNNIDIKVYDPAGGSRSFSEAYGWGQKSSCLEKADPAV